MRLFIAITFDDEMKNKLYQAVEKLKSMALHGSFTRKENLHLTLNFIGETKRVEEVKHAMTEAVRNSKLPAFDFTVKGFGSFKRREGDIYWLGIEQNPDLARLQKLLLKALKEAGFYEIDDREFKPHLTLGRQVRVQDGFDSKNLSIPEKLIQRVTKISLMNSERIEGKLTYTEIYHVELDKD